MKPAGYVDVDMFRTIFGDDHDVTQVYHPTSDDPKLVRKYTKMMSRASMLSDYSSFRSDHDTPSLYLIGVNDELFASEESPTIFLKRDNMKLVVMDEATHSTSLQKPWRNPQWIDAL
jgi:hypothetical protein